MTSRDLTSWPVPLKRRDTDLGQAVREYARGTEASGDEAAAYARVLSRVAGRPRRTLWLVSGFAMAAAAVMAMVAASRNAVPPAPKVASPQVSPPVHAPRPVPPRQQPPAAFVRLAAEPSALPVGQIELGDEARAVLSADTVAKGRTRADCTEVALDKGSIELYVRPRAPGHDFAVSAGGYRFMVVGTAFSVSQTETRLELSVSEGKVAVWRGGERLITVGAGGQWAVPLAPAAHQRARGPARPTPALALRAPERSVVPAPSLSAATVAKTEPPVAPPEAPAAPEPNPPQAAVPVRRDCGQIAASGNPQEAMACYGQQAAKGGLAGEAAQYEMARLWRDVFHDPARALAGFREQRSRFPRGVLTIEADLSIIELLPRLERHAEALAESERFLKQHPGVERRGEIHLLRGNIYREALRDFEHAEREYAWGAEARGQVGDESRFLRAVCLEALGRTREARAAYGAYLSQPKGAHAADARRRLERLGP